MSLVPTTGVGVTMTSSAQNTNFYPNTFIFTGSANISDSGTLTQYLVTKQGGISACVTGTKSITLPVTSYINQPIILVFDETTAGAAKLSSKSTTGFTVTCTGASDVFDWFVVPNPY
jgi:hypothetical protein